jgi:hypothetical protein
VKAIIIGVPKWVIGKGLMALWRYIFLSEQSPCMMIAEAMFLGTLPFHHKDPFDRMLIAQALINRLSLMSDDSKFVQCECKII